MPLIAQVTAAVAVASAAAREAVASYAPPPAEAERAAPSSAAKKRGRPPGKKSGTIYISYLCVRLWRRHVIT